MRSTRDAVMHNASSTARQHIGQGKPSLGDSLMGHGQSVVSSMWMGYGTDRDGISVETDLRLSNRRDQHRLVVEGWRVERVRDLIGLGHGGHRHLIKMLRGQRAEYTDQTAEQTAGQRLEHRGRAQTPFRVSR